MVVVVTGCGRRHFDERLDAAIIDAALVDAGIEIGCSDGTREGFADTTAFPTIAGCVASWPGTPTMRAVRTGGVCGNNAGPCGVPADACASGWHICGDSGAPADLTARITEAQCNDAGTSASIAFVSSISHCVNCVNNCVNTATDCIYSTSYTCGTTVFTCYEPVCCGLGCSTSNACKGGVFPTMTKVGLNSVSCDAYASGLQSGVLCCRDP